ncbi:unnamed protein product [Paramecium sonneborni]|uniref:Uncharacterized protein n=1 Tax=Paramecium sonneborni TaxID=65129 RepID=A0A8S1LQ34_9CILI|nr:unnamed protein product [Paramecium sonneborni]
MNIKTLSMNNCFFQLRWKLKISTLRIYIFKCEQLFYFPSRISIRLLIL